MVFNDFMNGRANLKFCVNGKDFINDRVKAYLIATHINNPAH